jgi:hypothetical protein
MHKLLWKIDTGKNITVNYGDWGTDYCAVGAREHTRG